jgi:hypothetical protein
VLAILGLAAHEASAERVVRELAVTSTADRTSAVAP